MGGLIYGSMVGHFWTFLLKPPQPLMGLFFYRSIDERKRTWYLVSWTDLVTSFQITKKFGLTVQL